MLYTVVSYGIEWNLVNTVVDASSFDDACSQARRKGVTEIITAFPEKKGDRDVASSECVEHPAG